MAAVTGKFFGDELVKMWGFKGCRYLKIHIPINGLITITAEFNADKEQMEQLHSVLKKYRLEEIDAVID